MLLGFCGAAKQLYIVFAGGVVLEMGVVGGVWFLMMVCVVAMCRCC